MKNPELVPTQVGTTVAAFLSLHTLSILAGFADREKNALLPAIIIYLLLFKIYEWQDTRMRNLACFMTAVFPFFHQSMFVVPIIFTCLAADQNKLYTAFTNILTFMSIELDNVVIPIMNPMFGVNSEYIDWDAWERRLDSFMKGWDIPAVSETTAIRIRDIGITDAPMNIQDRTRLEAGETLNSVYKAASQYRNILMFTTAVVTFGFFGVTGFVAYFLLALVYYCTGATSEMRGTYANKPAQTCTDGIYKIEQHLFGFRIGHGIGVSVGGVLHTPYHVCNATTIRIGRSYLKPTYYHQEDDLVTYGGTPNFEAPSKDQIIYINTERDDGRTTYMTEASIDFSKNIMSWPSVTLPGESGSPVFMRQENGALSLVTLAGRWVRTHAEDATEFGRIYPFKTGPTVEPIRQIVMAPGKGKTRIVLPQLIEEALIHNSRGRILVAGPTRVVCNEIYKALQARGIKCGLNIKGGKGHCPSARVQIAAHQTMMLLIMKAQPLVKEAKLLIIDEAHFEDASTKMLCAYGRHFAENGGQLVEMSATLDGNFASESNFPIDDHEIKPEQIGDKIEELLAEDKRILVFVPGMNKMTNELVKRFASHNPIKLNRENYASEADRLAKTDNRLIFSTNIAECGINIEGLDVVIDFQTRFDYYYSGQIYAGDTLSINLASHIQRRGRVGRSQPGTYYYVPVIRNEGTISSATMDANIMMTGRRWAPPGTENELNITLTDNQVIKCLEEGCSPTEVSLRTELSGEWSKDNEKRMIQWKNGKVCYNGCGKNCGKDCIVKNCQWYDERLHDWLNSNKTAVRMQAV